MELQVRRTMEASAVATCDGEGAPRPRAHRWPAVCARWASESVVSQVKHSILHPPPPRPVVILPGALARCYCSRVDYKYAQRFCVACLYLPFATCVPAILASK